MGFNTAVMIMNDRLNEIGADAAFGKKLRDTIASAHREGRHGQGYSVLPSQHADTAQVVVIAANSIRPFGYGHWKDDDEALLRRIADEKGFRLVRKPIKDQRK